MTKARMARSANLAQDDTGVQMPGIELLEPVGSGAHSVVYRARRGASEVAVKLARDVEATRRQAVAREFTVEAAALARVRHRGIVGVIEAGTDADGRPMMVLEYVAGETLAEKLARGPLTTRETVDFGRQIAGALAAVHARRLVHRDIKPSNILIDPSGQLRLIDFGLAGRERGQRKDEAVGTFLYAAPEQSGALKLGVDGRADLYALGVVLYECLAGEPPFVAATVPEIVHMHANMPARRVRDLREDVSATLSAVIEKLLAKDPDDRYQTAESLLFDLERVDAFGPERLGREHTDKDLAGLLSLIGRADVMGKLLSRLAQSHRGHGSVMVLSGSDGVGKTRVAQELARRSVLALGTPLWSYRASSSAAPLTVFRSLIDRLLERMHKLPESDQAELRLKLSQAAGEYAAFLAQAFVALRPLFGTSAQEHVDEGGSEVVYDALSHFFVELSQRLPSLLLVIEHAQALDSASLKVLRRMAYRVHESRLCVLLTVQGNDGAAAAEVARKLDGRVDLEIALTPLDDGAVSEMASSYLGTGKLEADFVQHLIARSHGNPRLLSEYLDALLEAGALRPRDGGFAFDRKALRSLSLPEDSSRLFLARLEGLPEPVHAILAGASVLGTEFALDELPELTERSVDEVVDALALGEAARLVERASAGNFAFIDERVREFLYDQIEPAQRHVYHLRASAIAERAEARGDGEALFRAARHNFEGLCEDNAASAFEKNLRAGTLALERRATREAIAYLEQARTIAERFSLPTVPELLDRMADAHAQGGYMERAFEWYDKAIRHAPSELDRAALHVRVAELHMHANFDINDMERHLVEAWRCLDLRFPKNNPSGVFWFFYYALVATLIDVTGLGFGKAKDKRRAKLEQRLFENTSKWAYFSNKFFLLLAIAFRLFYAGLRVGPSRELVSAYGTHGASLANMGMPERWSEHYMVKAERAAQSLGDRQAIVRAAYWRAVMLSQQGKMIEHARSLDNLLVKEGRWFEITDLFFAYIDLSLSYSIRGYSEASHAVMRRCIDEISAKAGAEASEAKMSREMVANAESMFNRPAQVANVMKERLKPDLDPERDSFMWFQGWSMQVGLRLETGDLDFMDEAIDNADRAKRSPMTAGWQFSIYWVSKGYARLEQCFATSEQDKPRRLAQLRSAIRELDHPAKRAIFKLHQLILEAGYQHLHGKHELALELLGKAELLAQKHDSPQGLYDMHRLRARVLGAMGNDKAMQRDANLAHAIAEQQGWVHRMRLLRKQFAVGQVSSHAHPSSSSHISVPALQNTGAFGASAESMALRRDRDALLEVSLAASHVFDPREQAGVALEKLLTILGGERALLFLWNDDEQELSLVAARNAKAEPLPDDLAYPRSAIEWVRVMRAPLVVNGNEEATSLGSDTIVRLGLRSVIAAPLMLRERFAGVVYLDSSVAKGVFTEGDLDILKAIANQIAVSQETAKSAQREIERRELQKDLQLTAAVQSLLLPKQDLLCHGEIEIIGLYQPASRVGGDFWFADTTREGRVRLLVGDVTGHGAGSAMVTAVMAGCYRATRAVAETPDVHAGIALMDRILRDSCEGQYTMPLSALEIDEHGRVDWWNAASPPLIVLRSSGELETRIGKGMPLGSDELVLGHDVVTLGQGDRMLVFTDGVPELELMGGRQLGLRRLIKLFKQTADMPLHQARQHLSEGLKLASEGLPRSDDMTLVIVARR